MTHSSAPISPRSLVLLAVHPTRIQCPSGHMAFVRHIGVVHTLAPRCIATCTSSDDFQWLPQEQRPLLPSGAVRTRRLDIDNSAHMHENPRTRPHTHTQTGRKSGRTTILGRAQEETNPISASVCLSCSPPDSTPILLRDAVIARSVSPRSPQ